MTYDDFLTSIASMSSEKRISMYVKSAFYLNLNSRGKAVNEEQELRREGTTEILHRLLSRSLMRSEASIMPEKDFWDQLISTARHWQIMPSFQQATIRALTDTVDEASNA